MVSISVRNLPEETHKALKKRAAENGRSMQAEMRAILREALWTSGHLKLGSYIVAMAEEFGGVDLNIERDRSPIQLPTFD